MAPRENSHEPSGTPVPVETGYATLATLRTGVKAYVEKEGGLRKAEILNQAVRGGHLKFYVHYEEFNKRLDEWVSTDRIDLTKPVEWPAPEKPEKKKAQAPKKDVPPRPDQKNLKRSRSKLDREISATPSEATSVNIPGKAPRPSKAGGKENKEIVVTSEVPDGSTPKPEDEEMDLVDVQDAAAQAKAAAPENFSREEEIEKLRTGGSMTQNQTEISRVRNLDKIQMGKYEVEPWYFSPYPIDFVDSEMVYICEFCLSYYGEVTSFERHRSKCTLLHPPGNEIYRDDNVSFFEIDGRRQRTWCRNLCLLSKLFLDHKTLYYDVDPFLFYCMAVRDEHGCHLVGYFSKEKESAEGYNVACILTLPQYQRKGYGKVLIDFSYLLSKRENKLGSPEKPLSDLGLLGYRAYWQEVIVDLLIEDKVEANIEDIGAVTAMTTNDVLHTLQNLNMLRYSKNQHVIVLTDAVIEQRERQKAKEKIKGKRNIDPEKLIWKPPVFSAASRTWNW
ncbi:histone acetyltransferase ESA1 [Lophiostoma macrostomum CBS 122681]|uniref:Histone acetyltransferase ESA1 n=1 Tax=Lophiostoma macrostomum CBS 122681 TaxID=1314788 RepID=A0A6A6TGN9_9PLEO|nr:histone acetyltransferase ESA1 [Lophiostoma macrostomum CBS 122681]